MSGVNRDNGKKPAAAAAEQRSTDVNLKVKSQVVRADLAS
jgi:hypothetical protein